MRLTLTRGEKCTSSMNPVFNVYGTTLIVLAEWKATEGKTTYDNVAGISLITASQRRNSPNTVDSKIHHNNLINNILPKIQANLAGCADAIMLDVEGYVSETNATNIFMVDDGVLLTPHADACLPGITRATVLALAAELGIPVEVRRVSLSEFHSADEVFTTGTMGELTPVTKIDGRVIGTGVRGPITERLQNTYKTLPERPGWATEIPPFEC
jgi:branched-subunit amino acid aminotransferase/4-amino-4-deoxychorismate lyase